MQDHKNENQYLSYFRTKDFDTASLLYAMGRTLDSTEWINGVCFFIFQNDQKCLKIVGDFYNGLIKENVKIIFDAQKTIKGILRST